ncbi:MAG: peptide chain release factor 1 [Gammaproteobacteria bacterium]
MLKTIEEKLFNLKKRSEEINDLLAQQGVASDIQKFTKLNKELSDIMPIVEAFDEMNVLLNQKKDTKSLFDSDDDEIVSMAEDELLILNKKIASIESKLKILLLPKDDADAGAAYLEIRAGAGGEEAAIFVSDLYRLYTRFAERQKWSVEEINIRAAEQGGLKEVVIKLNGNNVYKYMKFESGVHRVQRVPDTESQGRIHTSTVTVAILPDVEEVDDINLEKTDLRIDTFRASGAGGQHVNKTDSAIRITHIPSGMVVECQDDRSQHKNKAKAMALLAAKLREKELQERQASRASERKILVGSGDRSEKIRTYNFPQGRVTDHRIKLTQHNLDQVMDGDIVSICDALISENQLAQLENLES